MARIRLSKAHEGILIELYGRTAKTADDEAEIIKKIARMAMRFLLIPSGS